MLLQVYSLALWVLLLKEDNQIKNLQVLKDTLKLTIQEISKTNQPPSWETMKMTVMTVISVASHLTKEMTLL